MHRAKDAQNRACVIVVRFRLNFILDPSSKIDCIVAIFSHSIALTNEKGN